MQVIKSFRSRKLNGKKHYVFESFSHLSVQEKIDDRNLRWFKDALH